MTTEEEEFLKNIGIFLFALFYIWCIIKLTKWTSMFKGVPTMENIPPPPKPIAKYSGLSYSELRKLRDKRLKQLKALNEQIIKFDEQINKNK